ncbi:hypothetical protein [Flavobacterium cellulosilyticum]|uniref:Lipoprotein n=1 Tax=Flavobacterium cellulosilyticum TaxID=2541731 RepID=A0A4R5C9X0_9FLAO|nr:hypothetical protein [Flavobacterium cellulosilyticum]TDD95569.1 hypothetical protein E0F76_13995 [Flavobacterium cellulosilyticum]
MKTTILYLIVISFLFQSCYTYRAIDLKGTSLEVGKNYKIGQDMKFVKSKLQVVNDSTITIKVRNTQQEISISNIKEFKEQKYSTLKTVGFVLGIGLVTVGVVGAIAMSDFGFGDGFTLAQN